MTTGPTFYKAAGNKISVVTSEYFQTGDVIQIDGKIFSVYEVKNTYFTVRGIPWYRKLWIKIICMLSKMF